MQASPQTETVSPITANELADFIGADIKDPLLNGLLESSTEVVINHLNHDILPRPWLAIIRPSDLMPRQLSPYPHEFLTFELPYTGLLSLDSVKYEDGTNVSYVLQATRPAKLTLTDWDRQRLVKVQYTAGFEIIPAALKTAILSLSSFMYDHRGSCDAMEALSKSGAKMLCAPYRVHVML